MAGTFRWVPATKAYSINSTGTRLVTPFPTADSSFPARNCAREDRFIVWGCPAGGSDQTLHFDLGSARTIRLLAFLAARTDWVGTATVYAWAGGSANPQGTGTAINSGLPIFSLTSSVRDYLFLLPNALTFRYWDFLVNFSAYPMTLGKVLVGDYSDLGISYSPGAIEAHRRTRVRTPSVMGADVVTETGLPTYELSMPFLNVVQTMRDTLVDLATASPVTLIHPTRGICEADVEDDTVPATHLSGPPDVYNVELHMRTLP